MNDTAQIKPACDLVLKGGITSGVIYPRLVSTLAKTYRFKNIGGASAGAIAAASAAAAEYGRNHGKPESFDLLDDLPDVLSEKSPGSKRSFLFNLFQPSPSLKRHFDVIVSTLNLSNGIKPLAAIILNLLCRFWPAALLGAIPGAIALLAIVSGSTKELWPTAALISAALLTIWGFALLLAILKYLYFGRFYTAFAVFSAAGMLGTALIWETFTTHSGFAHLALYVLAIGLVVVAIAATAIAAASLWFAMTFGRALPLNNFGICTGMPTANATPQPEALTAWLYEYINNLAGKPPNALPLTFGDLWGCNTSDEEDKMARTLKPSLREVNLEMMTTSVSQGLPFRLPFRHNVSETFLFDPTEWAALFPQAVFNHILNNSVCSTALHPESKKPLRHIPGAADFPVVVGVRMSLSFPILLCAVPLYSVDRSLRVNRGTQSAIATRVWFSDGGISSNLPLHFFDAKLPSHPTFAINLKSFHPDHLPNENDKPGYENGRVYLPTKPGAGLTRYWTAQTKDSGLGGVMSFLWSIIETMHNWHDEILFIYPGYRDRIVQISQFADEGGINLDMPPKHIATLGAAGQNAAQQLLDHFAPAKDSGAMSEGWASHRTVRLRTLLGEMERLALEIEATDTADQDWRGLLANLPNYRFQYKSDEHVALGEHLLDNVRSAAKDLLGARKNSGISLTDDEPKPAPELRTTPQI